jgi:hypothetical protein
MYFYFNKIKLMNIGGIIEEYLFYWLVNLEVGESVCRWMKE